MSLEALRRTIAVVEVAWLKTRSFLAFQISQRITAQPACHTRESIAVGGGRSHKEKRMGGTSTPSQDQIAAARSQSKKRCLTVSGAGQAVQMSDVAQFLKKWLHCVLSLPMSERQEKILTLVGRQEL
jgi:hypothetical protein